MTLELQYLVLQADADVWVKLFSTQAVAYTYTY